MTASANRWPDLTIIRSLAGHPARHRIRLIPLNPPLVRPLAAAVHSTRQLPGHVGDFLNCFLF